MWKYKMAKGGGVDDKEITYNNYEKVIEEINYEFSRIQTKNIKLIVGKIINELSGKYDGFSSGGGISHIFLQLKDNTWIGFHNEFGDITISSPFPTLNKLINAWNSDDWEKVTGNSLKNYKSNQTFYSIDIIVSDIKNKSFSSAKYADGGGIDLFEDYDNIPANVQRVLDKYEDAFMDGDFKVLKEAKNELNKIGYTFDFDMDGTAYGLRPLNKMANGGSIKNNNDYMRATDKYDLIGALLDDAREENNTTEIIKLREQMEKLETEINRYERNYADGGGIENNINKKYLDSISESKKQSILRNIANHYGTSIADAEKEVTDIESEALYEYITNESLRMEVYNGMKNSKYADGGSVGEIEAKIADFRRRAENKSIPESAKNKFLSMAEELEKTLPKAEKKEEAKAEKPKFKVGDVVVLQGGDALIKKITSIKENKKGEIIYSGYYESKPSEKFSMDGTELVIFKRPKKEPKEKGESNDDKEELIKMAKKMAIEKGLKGEINSELEAVRIIAYVMANESGFKKATVDDLGNNEYTIEVSPATEANNMAGMIINKFKDGTFEVSEMQAGDGGNFINVFGEYKKLKPALVQLLKGNKQKPVKVIDMRSKGEKQKGESKKSELSEKDCIDLLEKYKAEREARKERVEKREKQGKPAELTPAETAKKAVDRVTDKIEAKAEKGKSVKGDIKAVFSQFKSAVAELKKYKNEIDEKEVRNLIKELESLLNK